MTRNRTSTSFTIEKLAYDCLDVRFLRRKGFFGEGWVSFGASLKWPRIAGMRITRYRLILHLRGHSAPQNIRVSWTKVHLGGERPWGTLMFMKACEVGLGGGVAPKRRPAPTRVENDARL